MSQPQLAPTDPSLLERARQVLPAGGMGNFAPDVVMRSGKAGRIRDTEGNEYVDFLLGSGPMLIGHCHPEVTAAVEAQLALGTTFFATNEHAIELAEMIVDATPCADKVRFVSSGSEATLYAMRLARAHRRRDKILKFEGGYHGMSDYALQSMAPKRPGNFPQAIADSAGIPKRVGDEVLIAPFNDLDAAVKMIREHADELAGVIVEPLQRLIPPAPGFLQGLRDITSELGIVLIFDEVVTGFRFAYGSAQSLYGVTPDLCSLGKVIGGGFPLAAIAGNDELMAHFDAGAVGPEDFTLQIGTLSGNPVAAAAGVATMKVLGRDGAAAYERLFESGNRLMQGLHEALGNKGIAHRIVGAPPMFDVVFTDRDVHNYRDIITGDAGKLTRFNQVLRRHGIFKSDAKFYVSVAHDERDLTQTLDAFEAGAEAIA